ncbi:unnamed protein product [Onchocerca ochengi]|uniref:Uncharacterized protein n=1 Tax=Onchocerca ochengi TaxID=42157 RepID=A0A182E301_ONCOC|nr:unnamed protein product [Onchocerca ochengi]
MRPTNQKITCWRSGKEEKPQKNSTDLDSEAESIQQNERKRQRIAQVRVERRAARLEGAWLGAIRSSSAASNLFCFEQNEHDSLGQYTKALPGQSPMDGHSITTRVFRQKLKSLMDFTVKHEVFGLSGRGVTIARAAIENRRANYHVPK